eukprot:m.192170 g.192170  ORF g.192170 m.192170 type:complete len:301 (-) comp15651_c0_seq23:2129-3031(-)
MTHVLDEFNVPLVKAYFQSWEKVREAAAALLAKYPRIRADSKQFCFNDGREQELLCLFGTIPVKVRGTLYNIPVDVWFLPDFPVSSPVVFVVPTASMVIKPSRVVDPNGQVASHLLFSWHSQLNENTSESNDTSSKAAKLVLKFLKVLRNEFGERCPVVAKSSATSVATHSMQEIPKKKLNPLIQTLDTRIAKELRSSYGSKLDELETCYTNKVQLLGSSDIISQAVSRANMEVHEFTEDALELDKDIAEISQILEASKFAEVSSNATSANNPHCVVTGKRFGPHYCFQSCSQPNCEACR